MEGTVQVGFKEQKSNNGLKVSCLPLNASLIQK